MKIKKSMQFTDMTGMVDSVVSPTQASHTPTPWSMKTGSWVIRGSDKIGVCEVQRTGFPEQAAKNAAFIVRACNNFENLLTELKILHELDKHDCDDTCGIKRSIDQAEAV